MSSHGHAGAMLRLRAAYRSFGTRSGGHFVRVAVPGRAPRVDVFIVGAGPAGAVAAERLAESGFDVVVLEQGDWPDYSRARAAEPDFEIDSAPEWGWSPNVRGRDQDYPIDCSASELDVLVYNAVGGGAVVYAAQ